MSEPFRSQPGDPEEFHVWQRDEAPAAHEFERYFRWLNSNDRVMDIGSGEGWFLAMLDERGIDAIGVDLNEGLAKVARGKGLEVVCKDALKALDEDASGVTVFSMIDFVEHIPLEALLGILKRIAAKPGVKVMIQTPNLDSVIGMKFWFHLPSHVTPLHPFFLRRTLETHGFRILDQWTDYGGLPWSGFRRWVTLKLLHGIFGPPVARMFLEGANYCVVAVSGQRTA